MPFTAIHNTHTTFCSMSNYSSVENDTIDWPSYNHTNTKPSNQIQTAVETGSGMTFPAYDHEQWSY